MIRRTGHNLYSVLCNLQKYSLNGQKSQDIFKENSETIKSWVLTYHRICGQRFWNQIQSWMGQFHKLNNLKNLDNRKFIFGVFAYSFDWDKERISDRDILKYSAEMSLVMFLRDKRDACLKQDSNPALCKCTVCSATDSEWQSFIDQDNITVWRREDENHRGEGLYCYKMYGTYDDVTAFDFLEAQVDLDYRLAWDSHAVKLELLDSEPSTNSDVIYWETKWPSLFKNRDYVFKRRYRIDNDRNLLFLVNRNTKHTAKPDVSSKQRVSEYWSYMVIKPRTTFDKPGLEFSLTYFDNPGSNVPSYMMNWVTTSAMPEFLKKLRLAAQGMAKKRGGTPSKLKNKMSRGNVSSDILLESLRQTMYLG